MFSQTVEYALRAVVYLAIRQGEVGTTDQIAEATKTPKPYLAKVLRNLSRAGLVTTQRGLGGGVSFSRNPAEVSILEVVNAVDPICRIHACPLGFKAHETGLCSLHFRLDHALAMVEQMFLTTTLAEVLTDPNGRKPLCESPSHRSLMS